MNLSQDEVNTLLSGNAPDEGAEAEPIEIMTPEMIAAMLDEVAGGEPEAAPAATSAAAAQEDSGDIMSPDAIAALLDAVTGEDAAPQASADSGDIMSPDAIAAMLDAVAAESEPQAVTTADPMKSVHVKEGMLTAEEIDILGEIGNISMGAVATTMYSLLDRRVSITTPRVTVFEAKDVLSIYNIPFVVATIEYVEGITGTNLLVLKIEDAALITDLLMGGEGVIEEPLELNEMHLSAMSEVMNQMMGASSTSLSKLLRMPINISPPRSTQVDIGFDIKDLLGNVDMVTKISFDMEIEGLLRSELIQLSPYEESRKFAKQFMDVGMAIPSGSEAPKAAAAPPKAAAPPAAAAPPPAPAPAPQPQQPQPAAPPPVAAAAPVPPPAMVPPPVAAQAVPPVMPPAYPADPYQQMPYPQAPYPPYPMAPYPPQPAHGRLVDVHPMQFQAFDAPGVSGDQKGIDLVYNIPLQVTVELGKTKKEINEILKFNTGTVVVLDKIAGDPVEIVVNGKLIARGEVVVIDENYGVRITDIVNN